MRNPNGYGSVVKLSGKRRRPYWVRKTVGWNDKGYPIYETIGYTETRQEGNILLAEFNKSPWNTGKTGITLEELYNEWKETGFRRLGKSNRSNLKSAYAHISHLSKMRYRDIRSFHMQETIDKCGRGYATQAAIKNLWRHLDIFATELDVTDRRCSELLISDPIPPTSRNRFTDDEIRRIWAYYNDKVLDNNHRSVPFRYLDTILILLYTGLRITELLTLKMSDIDLSEKIITGGIKTRAGKNRVIPIHIDIFPLVLNRYEENSIYFINEKGLPVSGSTYRRHWHRLMDHLQISKTPHECRHTFESVLDSNGANRKCIDLMMGHVSRDVGNRIYNHKTIDELRDAISLFKID